MNSARTSEMSFRTHCIGRVRSVTVYGRAVVWRLRVFFVRWVVALGKRESGDVSGTLGHLLDHFCLKKESAMLYLILLWKWKNNAVINSKCLW